MMAGDPVGLRALRPGTIFEVAAGAGIELRARSGKVPIKCPFHDDRHPSAFLSETNTFFCTRCTPGGGIGAKRFAEALGLPWDQYAGRGALLLARAVGLGTPDPTFGPADAKRIWAAALARAQDDDAVDADRDVYDYLARRRLTPAWELRAVGIVADDAALHPAVRTWPGRRYRIVARLHDLVGETVGIQARGLDGCDPKTLVPKGCRISGTVFADSRGCRVLCGDAEDASTVVLGEGMTDYLALAIASPFAVLTAPGTSNACKAVGAWARDRRVLLALDNDEAGRSAIAPTARALYEHGASDVIRVTWPGAAKDACDVLDQRGEAGLTEFLTRARAGRAT